MAHVLAPVLEHEGAADRTLLLKVRRACGGSALINKSAVAALPALAQGELEQMVLRANPSGQAGGRSNAPPLAKEEPNDDDPADAQHLRRLLDAAQIGDPCEQGIPRHGILRKCEKAAAAGQIMETNLLAASDLPKTCLDLPLAAWMLAAGREFWAKLITGQCVPGDCINRLTHVASLANDSRYQPEVAARAAVRYDADRMSSVLLGASFLTVASSRASCSGDACAISTAQRLNASCKKNTALEIHAKSAVLR